MVEWHRKRIDNSVMTVYKTFNLWIRTSDGSTNDIKQTIIIDACRVVYNLGYDTKFYI